MLTAALDYTLPEELIAQHPCARRDAARLLVADRAAGTLREDEFSNLSQYLRAGDCLALNDTRVIRARLHGKKATGGRVEIFLLHEEAPGRWLALLRPSAKVKPGTEVHLAGGIVATAEEVLPDGRRMVRFDRPEVVEMLEEVGEIPLPPYIHRPEAEADDAQRYQTVYAGAPGAVAAPTAGLHYTEALLAELESRGVGRAQLTLHVGYGTFKQVTVESLAEHRVDPEEFSFSVAAAEQLNQARAAGGRVVAVGTTSTRVLETQWRGGAFLPGEGRTDTYIYPPYEFRGVDVLQTNFHLPKSSLLALVCAFGGTEFILEAYRYAVREGFRFYSYGDAMLIL